MDLKQLAYFTHVAEARSFSRASTILGIAQPALSRHVRQLEAELKQELFIRDGRGVRLTEAGTNLLSHAGDILRRVNLAREEIEGLRGSPTGRVTVGMPTTVTKMIIAPLTGQFQRRFPRATLRIVDGLSTYLKEFLSAGRIDIAVLFDMQPSRAFDIFPLLSESVCLISARSVSRSSEPITLDEVSRLPLIMPTRPNATRVRIEQEMARIGKRPQIAMEIDAIAPTLELVAAGHGSTALGPNAIRAWAPTSGLVARQIVRPRLVMQTSMVVSTRGPLSSLQSATLDLIREVGRPILSQPKQGVSPSHQSPRSAR